MAVICRLPNWHGFIQLVCLLNASKEIEDIWIELYALYFGGDPETQIVTMSESIVPYYYYKKEQ